MNRSFSKIYGKHLRAMSLVLLVIMLMLSKEYFILFTFVTGSLVMAFIDYVCFSKS